jgi:cell division protein FtsL
MGKTKKKVKMRRIDRFMIFLIGLLVVSSPVLIVYSKSMLSKSNIEVERIKNKIEKQETINESISMKINELASLSNIQDIAKEYGLSYQNENIVVVK